jgi:hypothetical protein
MPRILIGHTHTHTHTHTHVCLCLRVRVGEVYARERAYVRDRDRGRERLFTHDNGHSRSLTLSHKSLAHSLSHTGRRCTTRREGVMRTLWRSSSKTMPTVTSAASRATPPSTTLVSLSLSLSLSI